MSRKSKRISRALIGLLLCTIVLGIAFYARNATRGRPAANAVELARPPVTPPAKADAAPAVAKAPDGPAGAATVDAPAKPLVITTSLPIGPAASQQPAFAAPDAPAGRAVAVQTSTAQPPAAPSTRPADAGPLVIGGVPAPAPVPARVSLSATPLADAQAQLDNGQLLTARKTANDALISGRLSPADQAAAKQLLAKINQTVVFSPRKFPDDPYGGVFTVPPGGVMDKIAKSNSVTWELLCRVNGMTDPRRLRSGQTLKLVKGPFHAVVSKSAYTMDLYLGAGPTAPDALYVTTFRVGLGTDNSTPTGTWLVEPNKKLKNPTYYSPRGEGVIAADDPKNPLGEYWLGLTGIDGHAVGKASYGIHGTIEPDSIGKMASMGCIRLVNDDVGQVYELLVEGKSTVMVTE